MRVALLFVPIEVFGFPFRRDCVFHCPSLSLRPTTLSANDRGGAKSGERGGGGRGLDLAPTSKDAGGTNNGDRGGAGRTAREIEDTGRQSWFTLSPSLAVLRADSTANCSIDSFVCAIDGDCDDEIRF